MGSFHVGGAQSQDIDAGRGSEDRKPADDGPEKPGLCESRQQHLYNTGDCEQKVQEFYRSIRGNVDRAESLNGQQPRDSGSGNLDMAGHKSQPFHINDCEYGRMTKIVPLLKKNDGFSLLELILTMTLVMIVLTMNTDTFSMIMRQSRQQAQVANAGMNRIIGFEVLRTDVEMAGYGLPWTLPAGTNYAEATAASTYNDSPSGAPHAIMSGDNAGYNGSDYLVVKGSAVGSSDTAQKWSFVINDGTAAAPKAKLWTVPSDLKTGERVIAIWANTTGTFDKQLVLNGASVFGTVADATGTLPAGLKPWTQSEWFLVYAIDPNTDLRMPFNRADYYVARPANMPQGCAPNTGILYKAPVSHADGSLANPIPLLDCVADMQVAFVLDTNGDGVVDYTFTTDNAPTNDISGLTAKQVRDQVKEVRIYVLSHEGTTDQGFTYGNNTVRVGETTPNTGRDFNLSTTIGAGWQNYRWKVDTLVLAPKNILK
jgi:hypothetical protein